MSEVQSKEEVAGPLQVASSIDVGMIMGAVVNTPENVAAAQLRDYRTTQPLNETRRIAIDYIIECAAFDLAHRYRLSLHEIEDHPVSLKIKFDEPIGQNFVITYSIGSSKFDREISMRKNDDPAEVGEMLAKWIVEDFRSL